VHFFKYSAPAYNITIDQPKDVYNIDEVINCSALGWPEPRIHWRPISSPKSDQKAVNGPSLVISADMAGPNVWECVAVNSVNDASKTEAVVQIVFNATGKTKELLVDMDQFLELNFQQVMTMN
jgi:hypothetical protein